MKATILLHRRCFLSIRSTDLETDNNYPGYEDRKYVVYFDPNASEDKQVLFCCRYDDEGNLFEVTEEDEWNMVDEVVNTFYSDDEEE